MHIRRVTTRTCATLRTDTENDPLHTGFTYLIYRWDRNNGDKALKYFGNRSVREKWHIGREQKRPQYVTQAIVRKGASMPINSRTKPEA